MYCTVLSLLPRVLNTSCITAIEKSIAEMSAHDCWKYKKAVALYPRRLWSLDPIEWASVSIMRRYNIYITFVSDITAKILHTFTSDITVKTSNVYIRHYRGRTYISTDQVIAKRKSSNNNNKIYEVNKVRSISGDLRCYSISQNLFLGSLF